MHSLEFKVMITYLFCFCFFLLKELYSHISSVHSDRCRDGAVVRALEFHQCGSGLDSKTWRHMWVEFVGSLLCTERFSPGTPVFPSPQKPTFDLICVDC